MMEVALVNDGPVCFVEIPFSEQSLRYHPLRATPSGFITNHQKERIPGDMALLC